MAGAEYCRRYKILQDTILSKLENGIDRYAAIVSFNEGFYKLRRTEKTFLSEIAFVPRTIPARNRRQSDTLSPLTLERDSLAKTVIEYMNTIKWTEIYGLNYAQTMELPYAEWIVMQEKLNEKGIKTLRDIESLPTDEG